MKRSSSFSIRTGREREAGIGASVGVALSDDCHTLRFRFLSRLSIFLFEYARCRSLLSPNLFCGIRELPVFSNFARVLAKCKDLFCLYGPYGDSFYRLESFCCDRTRCQSVFEKFFPYYLSHAGLDFFCGGCHALDLLIQPDGGILELHA